MAGASIPVDLTNPGQVFACLGLAEAADVLLGAAHGVFDWQDPDSVRFHLAADGTDDPVVRVLRFLDEATVTSLAPAGSINQTEKWNVDTVVDHSRAFPFPDPESAAKLPARVADADHVIVIDYWGDATRRRDNVKFLGGRGRISRRRTGARCDRVVAWVRPRAFPGSLLRWLRSRAGVSASTGGVITYRSMLGFRPMLMAMS